MQGHAATADGQVGQEVFAVGNFLAVARSGLEADIITASANQAPVLHGLVQRSCVMSYT